MHHLLKLFFFLNIFLFFLSVRVRQSESESASPSPLVRVRVRQSESGSAFYLHPNLEEKTLYVYAREVQERFVPLANILNLL